MRRRGKSLAALGVALLASACGGGSPTVSGGPTTAPLVTPSSSGPASAAPSAVRTTHHATTPKRTPAATSPTASQSTPATVRSTSPAPAKTTAKPTPKPTHTSPTACAVSGKTAPLTIINSGVSWQFSPQTVTIGCGTKVTVTNRSNADHTWTGHSWDSGNLSAGTGSYSYVFRFPGSFSFLCSYHTYMTGKVVVSTT